MPEHFGQAMPSGSSGTPPSFELLGCSSLSNTAVVLKRIEMVANVSISSAMCPNPHSLISPRSLPLAVANLSENKTVGSDEIIVLR